MSASDGAILGVSDHGGWAIFVTVARDGAVLDRRRVELVDDDLPAIPHHHEGQMMPIDDAVHLVERVRVSAEKHAIRALDDMSNAVPDIVGIALRICQELPPTIAERLTDYRSRNVADWVMYRRALASAAEARGWHVYWFDAKAALRSDGEALRKRMSAPWNNDHKIAMAGALTAHSSLRTRR